MKSATAHRCRNTTDARIPALRRALLRWYRATARDLPWRRTRDPYRIWLSEVLLQQTRVQTVIPYYERFLAAFPTVHALAAAPLEQVLALWAGLGYYTRAHNLHLAARVIAERRGMFPQTAAEWSDLPGVGSYTAAALASIAGGQAVAAVDGNVKRVLARLFGIEQSIDTPATQRKIWRLADTLLARRSPGEFNQALMELGARMCVPRAPDCEHCPIARWCTARSAGTQCELPRRGARRPPRRVHAVAAVVWRRGRILLVRRAHGRLLAGMWTLPGTDVENGVAPQAALVSALDSLGLSIAMGRTLGTVQHEFTHRSLRVHVFACHLQRGIRAQTPEAQWFSCSELETVPLASLDRKLLALAQPPRAEAGS